MQLADILPAKIAAYRECLGAIHHQGFGDGIRYILETIKGMEQDLLVLQAQEWARMRRDRSVIVQDDGISRANGLDR